MLDKTQYSKKFYLVSGIGSAVILIAGIASTYLMWECGFGNEVHANAIQTSILLSDSAANASAAAPLAIGSLNLFASRMGIKRFRKWAIKKFN